MRQTKEQKKFVKENLNLCGIYAIICNKNWRSYVGSSARIGKRIDSHLDALLNLRHNNTEMQKDFNEFGKESFFIELLETTEENRLLDLERKYIEVGCSLYNKTPISNHFPEFSERQKNLFWSKVSIADEDQCWNYTGSLDKDSFGRIGFWLNNKKRTFRSNRLAYFFTNPKDDYSLYVCHSCDNPLCCNPKHLFLGSPLINVQDCFSKKRRPNRFSKDQILWIRNIYRQLPNIHRAILCDMFNKEFDRKENPGYIIDIAKNLKYFDNDYTPPKRQSKHKFLSRDCTGKFIGGVP